MPGENNELWQRYFDAQRAVLLEELSIDGIEAARIEASASAEPSIVVDEAESKLRSARLKLAVFDARRALVMDLPADRRPID